MLPKADYCFQGGDGLDAGVRGLHQTINGHSGYARVMLPGVPWRRFFLYTALMSAAFVLGAVSGWFRARDYATQRDLAQDELRLAEMENTLSSAAIDARRGEFELARQSTSDFFNDLKTIVDGGRPAMGPALQKENLRALLSRRDHLITLLARDDPAAADDLLNLYIDYRERRLSVAPGI